jgi:hypothetical protein
MLLDELAMTPEDLRRVTGWEIKPEGACKGDICVPLAGGEVDAGGMIDVRRFADHMGMPLVTDDTHGVSALGPRAGGRVLADVALPEIVLPDFAGKPFDVASLLGRKVLLVAWSSW